MTEYLDSLQSTPEGDARYKEMARGAYLGGNIDKMPRRDGSYYIFKSADENKITSYDINGVEKYFYEEEIRQSAGADRLNRNYSRLHLSDGHRRFPWPQAGVYGLLPMCR